MMPERRPWKVSNNQAVASEVIDDNAAKAIDAAESPPWKEVTTEPPPKVKRWPSLDPCEARYHDPSSRPGRACLPRPENPPYRTDTYAKKYLGERAYIAAIGVVDESDCEGWRLFGDMTWCKRAFTSRVGNEQPDGQVIGLSYGIEERDLWSELVSTDYGVPTRLFDCYQNPRDSPPLSGKAVNGSSCEGVPGHCYRTPYQAFRICLGGASNQRTTRQNREFESLQMHLKSRHRLSVHLKIDTEGAEWEELEWLVSSPADMDKIRTFDMEVHIGWLSASASEERKGLSAKERIARDIGTLEALGKYFRCTGSSMEVLAEEWSKREDGGRCRPKSCPEPDAHTATGFSVIQFAISWVHPQLLKTGAKPLPPKPELPTAGAVDESQISWSCTRAHGNRGSRPGVPCLPTIKPLPYQTQTKQRTELGDRAVKAASGVLFDQECIFHMAGDSTWCLEAFPNETSSSAKFIGLSYGVGAKDLWSERISQAKVRTRLYDCEAKMAFTSVASNGTKLCNKLGPSSAPCYATPFEAYHVCVGKTQHGAKGPFENIADHLSQRERLSVHMKIDIGDKSMEILEWILQSGEVEKLRTLDITLQLGASGSSIPLSERIEQDISTLEKFREVMQISGSTLESMAEQWAETAGRKCAERCEEPEAYAPGGFPLVLPFTISFVHGDLLT